MCSKGGGEVGAKKDCTIFSFLIFCSKSANKSSKGHTGCTHKLLTICNDVPLWCNILF